MFYDSDKHLGMKMEDVVDEESLDRYLSPIAERREELFST